MLVKLKDIAEIIISNVDKKTKENEKNVILCNFIDVYKNYAITRATSKSFMIASASKGEIDKFAIRKGYLAITKDSETRDDIGVGTYFADNFQNMLLGYHCALIKPDNSKVYSKFLNAFMQSYFVRKYYSLNASGSGQRYTLSIDTISNTPIILPPYDIQIKIGNLLSGIDKQIERNKDIVNKLQVLALCVFDYYSKKSFKGNIVTLGDVLIEKSKSKIQVNAIQDSTGNIPFFTSGETILFSNKKLTTGFNIFISTGGNAKVQAYYGDAAYSTDTWCTTAKNNLEYYLYGYLVRIESQMDKLYFHGTGLKHLQKNLFLMSHIKVPNKEVLEKYNSIVEPVYRQTSRIKQSINQLKELRNKLLPLLINQQLVQK